MKNTKKNLKNFSFSSDRSYSTFKREDLINELLTTEQLMTNEQTAREYKSLYYKRYLKILDALKEKLENFQEANLNKRVS